MLFERAILNADEMKAAEQAAINAGVSVETLMERAGAGAAEAAWRFAGPLPALVLCGPGNNGGDGYVVARRLRERGVAVKVASLGESRSRAASAARAAWDGEATTLEEAEPAPLLIDALFGTGLGRGLDRPVAEKLLELARSAAVRVAIDLPSGAATDDGGLLSAIPDYDLTVTFGAPKPSHFLQPAARHIGRLVIADIGVRAASELYLVGRPRLPPPGPGDHKYSRGYVAAVAGEMPGAAALMASAALKAGAGYVRLLGEQEPAGLPHAVVRSSGSDDPFEDHRIGCVALGPGLGTSAQARDLLAKAMAAGHPLILDADALTLAAREPALLKGASHIPVLTPHAAEFARLFGRLEGSKVEQARRTAASSGAVILFKGADTVIAAPNGRAAILPAVSHWLASAGTGDVLTGVIAAMRSRGLDPFEGACAGAWLHRRSAELAGPGLIADDLLSHLPAALAECR